MTPPLAGPWTDQGPWTDLLPQGHRIMQLSASFTDRYHVQSSTLPALKCPFLSKWAVTPVKGKQCPLEHHGLFGQLFHIKDKKWRTDCVWSLTFYKCLCSTVSSPAVTGASFWHSHLDWHHLMVVLSINVTPVPKVLYATISAKLFKATQVPNATFLYAPP